MEKINIADGIFIRLMTKQDIVHGQRLVHQAGWNQLEMDWERMLILDPESCFVVENESNILASIVCTVFEKVAWISMVLVDKKYRGQKIGQRMFEHALEHLQKKEIATIRLDATELGKNLYKKFGFQEEYSIIRYFKPGSKQTPVTITSKPLHLDEISTVLMLDKKATGSNRNKLIQHWFTEPEMQCYGIIDEMNQKELGYVIIRPGNHSVQVGPCVAIEEEIGYRLLQDAYSLNKDKGMFMDIPKAHQPANAWALEHGFQEQRQFVRMYWGQKIIEHKSNLWASFGPEKG